MYSCGRLLISECHMPLPIVVCWTQPFLENAADSALVLVYKLAACAIGDNLVVFMRVKWRDCSGREGVVIKYA